MCLYSVHVHVCACINTLCVAKRCVFVCGVYRSRDWSVVFFTSLKFHMYKMQFTRSFVHFRLQAHTHTLHTIVSIYI